MWLLMVEILGRKIVRVLLEELGGGGVLISTTKSRAKI